MRRVETGEGEGGSVLGGVVKNLSDKKRRRGARKRAVEEEEERGVLLLGEGVCEGGRRNRGSASIVFLLNYYVDSRKLLMSAHLPPKPFPSDY